GGEGRRGDQGRAGPGNRRPSGLELPSRAPSGAKAPNNSAINTALKRHSSTLLLHCFPHCRYVASGDAAELLLPVALPGEDRGNGHRTLQPGFWLRSAEQEAQFRRVFFIVFLR